MALRTHTCAAFLLAAGRPHARAARLPLRLRAGAARRVHAGEGILAGVLKRWVPVRMVSPSGLKGRHLLRRRAGAASVLRGARSSRPGGLLRGVLVADRLEPEPFEDGDETLLRTLAGEVLRAIEVERVMVVHPQDPRREGPVLPRHRGAQPRGQPGRRCSSRCWRARGSSPGLDFCAVTLVNEEEGKRVHRVARMSGVEPGGQGARGPHLRGQQRPGGQRGPLRRAAARARHQAMDRQVIFDDDTQVRGLGALKIFPLVAGRPDPGHAGRRLAAQGRAGRGRAADARGHRASRRRRRCCAPSSTSRWSGWPPPTA